MYEIWLVLNILWEIALGVWPLLAAAALAWVVLMILAARRPGACWRSAWRPAIVVAALVAVAAFLLVPGGTRSSLANLSYWVDWANLAAIALGFGAAAGAFVLPLRVLTGSRRTG